MGHTYTVVFKDYRADSLPEAAAAMLRDPEVWSIKGVEADGMATGSNAGYAVEHWQWDQAEHRLRVWFQ